MSDEKKMLVKGTSANALHAFVKTNFPDRFQEWIDALPEDSKKIYSGTIMAFEFYKIHDALVVPIQTVCALFYDNDLNKGLRDIGRHSSQFALKGVYKIFFRFGSPQFIIDRASRVFSNYYPEGKMRVAESSSNGVILQVVQFPEPYELIELNIKYWLEGVLDLLNRKERTIEITKAMTKGDPVTEYAVNWS